ncbi:MAG: hypothetical protein AAF654_07175 [Myxococcota bacterium]
MRIFVALAALVSACGSDPHLSVELRSALQPPADVDALTLTVRQDQQPSDTTDDPSGRILLQQRVALTDEQRFPLTLVLSPVDGTPSEIVIDAVLSLGGTPLAIARSVGRFETSGITELVIDFSAPSPP